MITCEEGTGKINLCRGVDISDNRFNTILPNWRGLFIDNNDVNLCGNPVLQNNDQLATTPQNNHLITKEYADSVYLGGGGPAVNTLSSTDVYAFYAENNAASPINSTYFSMQNTYQANRSTANPR